MDRYPTYDPNATCPKCHSEDVSVRHCDGPTYASLCRYPSPWNEIDHFHRTCQRCRYSWLEKTLDAKEAT